MINKKIEDTITAWEDDDDWWKVISGATYGDVIDGSKFFGKHVSLTFNRNEEDDTFYVRGYEYTFDLGSSGSGDIDEVSDYYQNYTLPVFYSETSDVIWVTPTAEGPLYNGGTGEASDGTDIQWFELKNGCINAGEATLYAITGVGFLAVPEGGSKALAVVAFGLAANEGYEEYSAMNSFYRTVDIYNRFLLLNSHY